MIGLFCFCSGSQPAGQMPGEAVCFLILLFIVIMPVCRHDKHCYLFFLNFIDKAMPVCNVS
jgi:hypothetical protein